MHQFHASIIIPVYNNAASLRKTLLAIGQQTIKPLETIVVDNGSTDDTIRVLRDFDWVTVIEENYFLNSPYSSRNRGIEIAKGNVIVFLDATCTPVEQWLERGLDFLEESGADLVGGDVKFDFSGGYNAARIYDSLVNIQMKASILERSVAKTANLFVKKNVIDDLGKFSEGIRSGGDVRWTNLATTNGYKLLFSEGALVMKETRSYLALVQKQWRISLAHPLVWEEDGRAQPLKYYIIDFIKIPRPGLIQLWIDKRGNPEMLGFKYRVWFFAIFASYVVKVAHLIGFLRLKLLGSNPK